MCSEKVTPGLRMEQGKRNRVLGHNIGAIRGLRCLPAPGWKNHRLWDIPAKPSER